MKTLEREREYQVKMEEATTESERLYFKRKLNELLQIELDIKHKKDSLEKSQVDLAIKTGI